MIIKTEEQIAQVVYGELKEYFSYLNKGWVYEDYFKDMLSGYHHFLTQFKNEFPNLKTSFIDDQELEDYTYSCFSEIESQLSRNLFLNTCMQSM